MSLPLGETGNLRFGGAGRVQRCALFLAEAGDQARLLIVRDRLIYAVVAVHVVIGSLLVAAAGILSPRAYSSYLVVWPVPFFLQFPIIYSLLGALQIVHRIDGRRRLAFSRVFAARRVGHFLAGLGLLAALMIFQGSFTSIKNAFPVWHDGFPYDTLQANIDRWLCFGHDPWRLLYAVAQYPAVRLVVELNYDYGWFVLCYAGLFWVVVSPEADALRTRYMLTYLAVWIVIGNVIAGVFLTAGPAFYGQVTGDAARFSEQLRFLAGSGMHDYSVRVVQRYLWGAYRSGQPGLGSGISAFPSIHVALVTMNALFLFERSRRWGVVAFSYVIFIVLSSVYLAWHYATDAYASIVITFMLFRLVRYFSERSARGKFPGKPCAD